MPVLDPRTDEEASEQDPFDAFDSCCSSWEEATDMTADIDAYVARKRGVDRDFHAREVEEEEEDGKRIVQNSSRDW